MKAFISYSHADQRFLDRLHVHLKQLQRDSLISTWTDKDILAGGKLDNEISQSLQNSQLFIALLSPDYISSNYCYEKEFQEALRMQQEDNLTIIPIVVEDCDWLNTPFKQFKALPKDGKPVSQWSNENTAFLNVIQEIRNLLSTSSLITAKPSKKQKVNSPKNYKIKKTFDSIQKLEFQEKTFKEVENYIEENILELESLDNIYAKITSKESKSFEAVLVNRNMIDMESTLTIDIDNNKNRLYQSLHSSEQGLNIIIGKSNGSRKEFSYSLSFDEYDLFWKINHFQTYGFNNETGKSSSKQIAEEIWEAWLSEVGIEF